MRDAFGTGLNRLRLFCGNRECAAAFQLFASRFPPAFPFGFIKKIGNHPFADLLRGCLSIEAFQNVPDKRDRVIFGQLFGCGEVACLAREKMFRRNNGQILGGVLELHRVGFFAGKIDQDLIEKKIPLCDPAKAPALVQTKRARLERVQFLGRFGSQFAGFDEFLELRVHESRTNYDEGSPWQATECLRLPSRVWHETLRAVATTSIWFWLAFNAGVFVALIVDLVQFKHRGRELSMRAAAQRTAIWIVLSLLFNLVVWKIRGPDKALEFLTGYVIEYSLSVDNIFVFVLIFAYFRVPPMAQHRALVWGIVGALVMRGVMIWLGIELVNRFEFILYVFGAFLLVSAWRMFFVKQKPQDFGQSWVMRCCLRAFPITPEFHDEHFKARVNDRWMLTPLALALIVIDVMDLVFAVDSIPAVFAITRDPFIVYTSNICAILGLRSLYFLLAKMVDRFIYLQTGLAFILGFIGIKMIVADYYPISNWISLAVIVFALGVTITISMIVTRHRAAADNRK